ncbi:MAG: protein kinase [Myxococcales bacterium]|nr:protein kinase [Myxococcales bacterium]
MPEAAKSDVGSLFGKYFLMKKLAAGGMGEIFLAKQQGPAGFQKILVVKKILAHLTENKEFIEAFLGEARLAAQMNHRNVVQVFELGQESGAYFIAMEYVAGKSLRDVIDVSIKKKEKLHPEHCRLICEMICDGASYAHNLTDMGGRSLNLVHRDLNPQNVLISYTGDVKVIDFGIAKSEMSTVKTEAGMIKGKFVYMSPEQSMAKKLDKRSDIFAIGISLYEMLTGINPFHKNNIVLTLEAVQRYDPPPPSEYDPSYAPFDPIVAKALAKDRDRRYGDAAEMMDDLRRVVLPRPAERLGQFMSRIFRAQVEEEQKMLIDSDSMRLTGGAPKRTPSKPTPAHAAPRQPAVATQPEVEGGTQMLPQAAMRKPAITPSKAGLAAAARPAPRPPPPAAAKKPQGAGDTLIDMDGVGDEVAPSPTMPHTDLVDDEVPGGTAMLKPGQALPPPPPRKPKPADTHPDGEAPEGATAFLGTAPARGPARKPAAPAGRQQPQSTNIMTPEESEAAQQEALAKMKEAENSVVRTRTRADKRAEMKVKKSSKGMWIMVCVGGLVAVAGVIALLLFAFADDSAGTPRRKKSSPVPVESTQVAPTPDPAPQENSAPPAEERPRPAPKKASAPSNDGAEQAAAEPPARPAPKKAPPAESDAAPAPKKVASGKILGTLLLNPGPNVAVFFGGNAMPKQVGAFSLPVSADNGTIEVGDDSTQFKVSLDYTVAGSSITFRVKSEPWAIATINGTSKGRTPVTDIKVEKAITLVELKKPGSDVGMPLRLGFKPN